MLVFLCVCPLIDREMRHNIVKKMRIHSTERLVHPHLFDNVMTRFTINIREQTYKKLTSIRWIEWTSYLHQTSSWPIRPRPWKNSSSRCSQSRSAGEFSTRKRTLSMCVTGCRWTLSSYIFFSPCEGSTGCSTWDGFEDVRCWSRRFTSCESSPRREAHTSLMTRTGVLECVRRTSTMMSTAPLK